MALVLNDEQTMLRDAARDFLSARAPVGHLRELRDAGKTDGFSRELWAEIADMGWAAILVPEEFGGLGYGFAGMGIVLQEIGRTLTPSPLLSTSMAAAALTRFGSDTQKAHYLPLVASGEHLFAIAFDECTQRDPFSYNTDITNVGDSYRLSGVKKAVVDASAADTFIVSARTGDDSIGAFLVPANASGIEITDVQHLDTHLAATVQLTDVEIPLHNTLCSGAEAQYMLDVGRIGQSAELLGIALEVFERTIEFLNERKQFGVPIGVFQGLTHRAAQLYTEIELCKSAVLNAFNVLDSGSDDIAETASLTKAKLAEVAHLAATEGIQMHGGMGMTDECDIGFFLKRCRIVESLCGDRYFHRDRYAQLKGY